MESGHGMSGDQCLSRRLISKIPFVMLFRNSQAGPVAEYIVIMHQCGETTSHPRVLLEPSQTPCGKGIPLASVSWSLSDLDCV